jgi:hypothetical protein
MDVMKRGVMSTRKVHKYWSILVTSLSNWYLNVKTISKKIGPPCVLSKEEDGNTSRFY